MDFDSDVEGKAGEDSVYESEDLEWKGNLNLRGQQRSLIGFKSSAQWKAAQAARWHRGLL